MTAFVGVWLAGRDGNFQEIRKAVMQKREETLPFPAYRNLTAKDLQEKVERSRHSLRDCRCCPRDCQVNRWENEWSVCKTGRFALVSSSFAHHGEEPCLSGFRGSGTIFFTHCNLRCVFCQNFDISQASRAAPAEGLPATELATIMCFLQHQGCHNINLVSPEHVVPQVVQGLVEAITRGLSLPVVYNTSGYDSMESLELLDGLIDIYMPDFKFWSEERSRQYLKAQDYPSSARQAIQHMWAQVGDLQLDASGIARRGVLIRHLVMPGLLDETEAILQWIAEELGPQTFVNLMDQYRPWGKVGPKSYPELNRRLLNSEWRDACRIARRLGFQLPH